MAGDRYTSIARVTYSYITLIAVYIRYLRGLWLQQIRRIRLTIFIKARAQVIVKVIVKPVTRHKKCSLRTTYLLAVWFNSYHQGQGPAYNSYFYFLTLKPGIS